MRLSEFIRLHMESILQAWENFARTIEPPALTMDKKALRNHAFHMLNVISDDLDRAQTLEEEIRKSEGHGKRGPDDTAAETHAIARLLSGYTIEQLVSEYRALRSSVLRLWAADSRSQLITDADDITRFNEAIDQAVAESIARYTEVFHQSRNLFLAILGHDLRNPLSAIINGAQLMMRSAELESSQQNLAVRIHNSGLRMNKLVDDLIDYTRTHLGSSLPITPKPANIPAVVQIAIDELRTAHPERMIVLNAAQNLDGKWDEQRIVQVFSNLLGNAVQHGVPDKPIVIEAYPENEEIVVTVNNQGPVLPPAVLQNIFEPLVRFIDPACAPSKRERNLGLGLYIAKEVVKAHGGTIDVRSREIEGTTFIVKLPRIAPSPPSVAMTG